MRAKASLLAIVGLTGSALVAGGGVQACAQGSGNTEQDISPTDESGELGGGGQSGQPTTGGSTGGLVVDGGVGDGALDDASACAADTFPGVLVPLDLYIMLDRSSSMDDGVKWPAVTSALQTFVTSPDCDGIGVGIQYFPVPPTDPIPVGCTTGADCGYYGPCLIAVCAGALAPDTSCDPVDYDSADVSIAELPGVLQNILDSLDLHPPVGSATPTRASMEGAVAYATNWAQNNPDHLTFIVYSTDGEPTGCGFQNSTSAAANLAATAASGSPPVKTFVIGVGSELTTLNDIATAGGTGQAFLVDTTVDVAQQFIDALNDIRAAGECKFQIPQPGTGVPDYEKVNVSLYDDDDPQDATTISYVSAEANCDPVTGGWYYDSPVDPQMIILCEASCDMVKLSDWSVNVLVGCETIAN